MYKILANTLFLGKDVYYLPDCHSTNQLAMEMLKDKKVAEGSVVITDHQTKGKGQRGNTWESQEGKNLTFSIILMPRFLEAMDQFQLNMVVSISILEALDGISTGLKVKWPNDIIHEVDGKIAGILIENIISQNKIESAIIGIGLNVNQRYFRIDTATSLSNLSGFDFDKHVLFEKLIQKLEFYYLELKKGNKKIIKEQYLNKLYRYQKLADFEDQVQFKGKILGIKDDGRLIIEKETGLQNYYAFKEVKFL
ncbi:BirA family transcriptional regulator, biotin operon repressor / biotin-[acetyl-CoA-carboxylase] ligase [Belliella buryatensis]|uniref:BirA family transcriptional regulator, biotin operon repressor / biotin-[acetyl-CoA-carboxylase] ligase n=1 Tax=Belliella buryatensis TaxID=1500549 RepID=A0A239G0H5_9BACT|nr:biotin--[acetyl-CoA-carboxylase] ligase [Belliella buryatensis]SNS62797.1 BirA family transcriptional regulator, biotin operon repressor / biotin-[acetyl-CoA-carboxylase] ligase [Belliella buryatensis]